jgi:hypothetical protein
MKLAPAVGKLRFLMKARRLYAEDVSRPMDGKVSGGAIRKRLKGAVPNRASREILNRFLEEKP